MKTILIIDDCVDTRSIIAQILSDSGYVVYVADSVKDAFIELAKDPVDLILCDLHLPFSLDKDHFQYGYSYEVGVRTIQELEWVYPGLPIVAISATAPWDMANAMKEITHIPALSKPISRASLLSTVSALLERHETAAVLQ